MLLYADAISFRQRWYYCATRSDEVSSLLERMFYCRDASHIATATPTMTSTIVIENTLLIDGLRAECAFDAAT